MLLAVAVTYLPFPGSMLSPLGVASMHSYGPIELEDEKVPPSPEGIGVVGIGRSQLSSVERVFKLKLISISRLYYMIVIHQSPPVRGVLYLP